MAKYVVNNNTTYNPGKHHEVHTTTCHVCPKNDYKNLGEHKDCQSAVKEAKETHSDADGCIHCCKPCHKG